MASGYQTSWRDSSKRNEKNRSCVCGSIEALGWRDANDALHTHKSLSASHERRFLILFWGGIIGGYWSFHVICLFDVQVQKWNQSKEFGDPTHGAWSPSLHWNRSSFGWLCLQWLTVWGKLQDTTHTESLLKKVWIVQWLYEKGRAFTADATTRKAGHYGG